MVWKETVSTRAAARSRAGCTRARLTRRLDDDEGTHHVVLFVLEDVAVPDVLVPASSRAGRNSEGNGGRLLTVPRGAGLKLSRAALRGGFSSFLGAASGVPETTSEALGCKPFKTQGKGRHEAAWF